MKLSIILFCFISFGLSSCSSLKKRNKSNIEKVQLILDLVYFQKVVPGEQHLVTKNNLHFTIANQKEVEIDSLVYDNTNQIIIKKETEYICNLHKNYKKNEAVKIYYHYLTVNDSLELKNIEIREPLMMP